MVLTPNTDARLIVPVKITPARDGGVHLSDPETQLYLSASPPQEEQGLSLISANRVEAQGWETFRLERGYKRVRSPSLRKMLRDINRFRGNHGAIETAGHRLEGHRLEGHRSDPLSRDEAGDDTFEILSCCSHCVSDAQARVLAKRFLSGDIRIERRQDHAAQDFWLHEALRSLVDWSAEKPDRPSVGEVLDKRYDRLDTDGLDGRWISLSHRLNSFARQEIQHRHKICLVATARNEGLYLVDWVAYHKSIGFEQIYIYSNDNDDGSDDVLRLLAAAGEIVWFRNDLEVGRKAQTKAYGHAFSMLPDILEYEWTAVLDIDEYLVIRASEFASLRDYLHFHERNGSDVIHLTWKIMSSCGQDGYDRIPLIDRFHRRLPYDDPHTKCIFRTKLCMHSQPHMPVLIDQEGARHVDAKGEPFVSLENKSLSARPITDPACVNHYFYKSRDEFMSKFSRNRGDYPLVKGQEILDMPADFEENFRRQFASTDSITDDDARNAAPNVDAYAARLLDLPGLTAALERAERWHAARVRAIGHRNLRLGLTGETT